MKRIGLTCGFAVFVAVAVVSSAAQAPSGPAYTVFTRDGRTTIPLRTSGSQEMFALEDVTKYFDLSVREDQASRSLLVTFRGQTIMLSLSQGLASAGGRLISLPGPPVREGRSWLVPVEFVNRALGPLAGTRVDLRKRSRLLLIGDVRVPQVAARHELLGSQARITFDITPPTPHSVAQEGNKLVIKFDADALDATLPAPTARELIDAVRMGEAPASVTIDLGPRFGTFRALDVPADRNLARLVVDVLPATTETTPTPTEPPLVDLAPIPGLRAIVIDPGHGGEEDGAKGPGGTLEKHVTLGVARRLKSAIEGRLGVRVILTREADVTVRLDERAALANNNKADLFISLHANASVRAAATGAEVFYLSLEEYGDQAQRVARGEAESLPVFSGGSRDIEVILWEMAQARHIQQSALAAQIVEAELRERVPMSARAIQQAPFRVLVGANMPAVLVEMGFISNAEQERQLTADAFQNSIVEALVDSIIRFRDAVAAGRTATPEEGKRDQERPSERRPREERK